jgi:hypothetical protein
VRRNHPRAVLQQDVAGSHSHNEIDASSLLKSCLRPSIQSINTINVHAVRLSHRSAGGTLPQTPREPPPSSLTAGRHPHPRLPLPDGPRPRPGVRYRGYGTHTAQRPATRLQSQGTRSRILKARQELSIMAHHEIQSLADLTTSTVSLQDKLCPLEQQRRFRRVFLSRELVQTTIQILRDTQIHSHDCVVPNQYQATIRLESPWLAPVDGDDGCLFSAFRQRRCPAVGKTSPSQVLTSFIAGEGQVTSSFSSGPLPRFQRFQLPSDGQGTFSPPPTC